MVWYVSYSSLGAVDWTLYKFGGEGGFNIALLQFVSVLFIDVLWSLL